MESFEKNIIEEIDREIYRTTPFEYRNHLGCSIIGKECSRYIWYHFRWAKLIQYSGKMQRTFRLGNLIEEETKKYLKKIGLNLVTEFINEEQFKVLAKFGHLGGSLDGIIKFNPHSNYGVWENKSHKDSLFNLLIKHDDLEKANFEHYCQCNLYAYLSGLRFWFYTATNKNNSEFWFKLGETNVELSEKLMRKGENIIFSDQPPPKLSESPNFFKCRWCDYRSICHQFELPSTNCRTCANVEIVRKLPKVNHSYGLIQCALKTKLFMPHRNFPWVLTRYMQEIGSECNFYILNPYFLNGIETISQGETKENSQYFIIKGMNGKKFKYGPNFDSLTSKILAEL